MARHSIAVALLFASAVSSQAQTSWPNGSFNPRPDKDDFLLPMPCKGSLTFRKVVTGRPPSAPTGALSDTQVKLGTERNDARGYIEYRRTEYVSGSFLEQQSGDVYYLIAKYELTNLQWQAVMTEGCKLKTGPEASMPKTNVSWFEAVDFTRRYTDWLYKNAIDRLPKSNGGPAYVRLPTEAEWEFAARGGQAVASAERDGDLFPLQGAPLSNYAWFSAPGADGEPQSIGLKRPNPLLLHDMLGNAEEIILEPFRMNKLGRQHGQIGGFITRGGSVMTEEQELTLATRQEYPFYSSDEKGEVRRPTVGFRVLVGSAATGDFNRSRELEQAFEAVQRDGKPAQPAATQKLEDLARGSKDATLRKQLTEVNGQLKIEMARRADADLRTVKTMMMSAILLVNELTQSAKAVRVYDAEAESETDQAAASDYKRKAESHVAFMKPFAQSYTDVIKQLGEDLAPQLDSAKQALRSELKARGQDATLEPTLNIVIGHVEAYRDGRTRDARVLIRMVTGDGRWLR